MPIDGRKSTISLNRTQLDFVSAGHDWKISRFTKRELGAIERERFHVKLFQVEIIGKSKIKYKRFLIKVIEGAPIKLNGIFTYEAYVERGDICEIGYNQLRFFFNEVQSDFDPQLKMIQRNSRIVHSSLPILLEGETGVGKTSLARKIHEFSGKKGQFVHLNLSAISANLIESELFGHTKGAFTGAINDKKGAFRNAQNGTLFLDEIDSLPIEIQTKLLTFLDNFEVIPVGANKPVSINTRLIVASGKNLWEEVSLKNMRKDFYFRVSSGKTFRLKPLRDNPERIQKFCEIFQVKENIVITKKLVEFYLSLPWPGNYRQLKSHLIRKKVLSKGTRLDFDQEDQVLLESSSELFNIEMEQTTSSLEEMKKIYAKKVYHQCDCNYSRAAVLLKITPRSLKGLLAA